MKNIAKHYGIYVLLALFISLYLELFHEARTFFLTGKYYGLLDNHYTPKLFLILFVFFVVSLIILLLLNHFKKIFIYMDKYRYIIGFAVIIICTLLELSGSSIGWFYEYLGNDYSSSQDLFSQGVIWGFPREIRTDEWATLTPLNFAQEFNDYGSVTDMLRGTQTDVTTFYANPNFSISTLFRPFLWGYLLLGSAKGLAFYWSSRAVCLFLVSYEFGKLLTNRRKMLSAAYACMILFSQTIQWWYSTNGLMEMFIFGQLAIILLYYLFRVDVLWKKALICLGLVECAGGYLLAYYPAQQVPLAYVFGAIALYVIIKNRKLIKARDIILLIASVVVFAGIIALVMYNSLDTITTTMNTAYPGKRVNTGGATQIPELFMYATSIFTPIQDQIGIIVLNNNVCEMAVFYSLFPVGIIYAIYNMIRSKKGDLLSILLIVIEIFFLIYSVVGFPPLLAKISFLSYSFHLRITNIIGFIDIILLFYALSKPKGKKSLPDKPLVVLIKAVIAIALAYACIYVLQSSGMKMAEIIWVPAGIILAWLLYLILRNTSEHKEKLAITLIVVITLSGMCVNPIQKGTDVVQNNTVTSEVKEIVKTDSDAKWITIFRNHIPNEITITVGAKTINTVHTYPNLALWRTFDPEGKYDNIYNRYAHVDIDITDEPTSFELPYIDSILVHLNYDDLNKLGANYILSYKEVDAPNVELIKTIDNHYIYKVK